jgi:hypothetical protein
MSFGQVAEHAHVIEHAQRRQRVFNALPTPSARHGACSGRCRMSDETPVPETLETIAASIRALRQSMDSRFDKVESRITTELAETKSQLGMKIEAVHAEVSLVYDEVIAQRAKHKANDEEHGRFRERLGNHHLRLLALTRRKNRHSK